MHISSLSCTGSVVSHFCQVTVLLFLFSSMAAGQSYFFEEYGVEEGLSSSKVYALIQDRDDNIWLGTESDVSRFDGTRFESFSSANGTAPNGVYSLCQDSIGRIWMGHLNGGISCYDGERFIRVHLDSIEISTDITSVKQAGKYLWVTTIADGAVRIPFPERGDTLVSGKQYKGKEGLSDQVFNMYIDREGVIYCITDAFIKKYIPATDSFETYNPPGLTNYFNVIVMFEDSKGNYWFGTHNGGLYMAEKATGKMKVFDSLRDGLAKNYITSITEDYKGDIWIGTWGGGITRFSGDEIKVFNKSNGLNSLYVHAMLEDKEKNILIADHNEGFSIYKGDFLITCSGEGFLSDKDVWTVSQDDRGRFWFGTNTGVTVFNPDNKKGREVTIYNNQSNNIGGNIRFIKNDNRGSMWIGTSGYGITRYDISTDRFIYDPSLNSNINQRIVTALEVDKYNNIWIGTHDRLVLWNKNDETATTYTQINGLCGNDITTLYYDRDGVLWIGSMAKNGLTKHVPGTDKFTVVDLGKEIEPRTISQTGDGRIWVGTTGGIYVLKDDKIVQTITEEEGLISKNIKLLQSDGDKYLYIGTTHGLNRYNIIDGSVASYTKRNGYTGLESHDNASFIDKDGKIWFGTANGVVRLDPAAAPPLFTTPVVHINKFDVRGVQRKMHEGMKLRFNENIFDFYYYSVCLYNPGSVKYKVMLKGADADWKPVTDQISASYPALSPGHYTFMVKASNNDGYWNEIPETFSFIIKPPFYYSPWFIVLYIIFVVVAIIVYIKMREAKLLKEKLMLEDKVEERTAEVVQKSLEIEAKNKDITASIRYAERIQRAMLPPENTFKETFVLFMPKDIVSGDFYWMYDEGFRKYIAAVDCTGHGVPGAFMSIIGHNSLTKIVREYGIKKPSDILNALHQEVVHALLQRTEKAIRDGMDISLIAYDIVEEVVEYAGAFHPLYHVRDGNVESIKADRFPVGFSEDGEPTSFTNHVVKVEKGDMLYMCSDGYADQFGGGNDRKFKTGRIKDILSKIYDKPVEEQKRRLEVALRQWMGDCPQVDDILFIGIRIT